MAILASSAPREPYFADDETALQIIHSPHIGALVLFSREPGAGAQISSGCGAVFPQEFVYPLGRRGQLTLIIEEENIPFLSGDEVGKKFQRYETGLFAEDFGVVERFGEMKIVLSLGC